MKIVIIGDGKVGLKIAKQLSEEDYDIVLIDQNEGRIKQTIKVKNRYKTPIYIARL